MHRLLIFALAVVMNSSLALVNSPSVGAEAGIVDPEVSSQVASQDEVSTEVGSTDEVDEVEPVDQVSNAQTPLMIIELQVASADSAGQEFVEIYNPGIAAVQFDDWALQYKSASSSNWVNKSLLIDQTEPRGRYLISSKGYLADIADVHGASSMGLSNSAGCVRIIQTVDQETTAGEITTEIVNDMVCWGSPQLDESGSLVHGAEDLAPAPASGSSLKRRVSQDGYFYQNQSNFQDFFTSVDPTPASDDSPPEPEPEPTDEPDGSGSSSSSGAGSGSTSGGTGSAGGSVALDPVTTVATVASGAGSSAGGGSYPTVIITELFPDPKSPQRDGDDEFIEIYNPNSFAVNMYGWELETGDPWRYDFTFPSFSLKSGQYAALSIKDTGATLSNAGSRARLVDPGGTTRAETPNYGKAIGGESYSRKADGTWAWSSFLTPSKANVIAASASASSGDAASSSSSSSSASGGSDSSGSGQKTG